MRELYKKLSDNLNEGRRVAIVSVYNSGTVKRAMVDEDDQEAWSNLGKDSGAGIGIVYNATGFTVCERYSLKPRLIILGGGHIALPLTRIGASLGFRVAVFDDRPSFANKARFPEATTVICDSFDNVTERLKINQHDYVVIVTRGHRHDSLCLRSILQSVFPRYVGLIGSRRRVGIVKKQIAEETGEADKLEKLHSPIGLAIGAVTPDEIAISIIAEVIKDLRLGLPSTNDSLAPKPWQFITPDLELLAWLASDCGQEKAAMATVVAADGSTPREAGAKMVIFSHGQILGSIGGGCAEAGVMQKAQDIIRDGGYCLVDIDLTDAAEDDGMVCGGTMKILVEAI
ncbi:MAG: XdhC family protein [Dehalococcoidia bacterium]|nr:XdhC family protein [Dehalococcoidia bacterium]